MKKINQKELKNMIDHTSHFILVAVLRVETYIRSHIPGSINIPLDKEFSDIIKTIVPDKKETIVLYGVNYKDKDSENAAKKLEKMKYTKVIDFENGIKSWDEAGYPLKMGH